MTMLREAAISFPMFGEGFVINPPDSFTIFGFEFYLYGAIIALGFILAIWYCGRRSRQFGISQDNLLDLLIFALPIGIIGARLYYVIFNFDLYRGDFLSIFNIRNGGLAIYGGIIAGALTAFIFCRIKKIPAGAVLDLGAFGLLIGQTMGRWGNFFNREAFGAETDIFCRMGLTLPGGETIYVHPTFLYESVWNLAGFVFLHIFSKSGKRKYDGQIFIMYAGWYGLGRVFIEGLRTDSLYLFGSGVRVSQLVAGLSVLVAAAILFVNAREKHDPGKLWVNRSPVTAAGPESEAAPLAEDGAPAAEEASESSSGEAKGEPEKAETGDDIRT